jgi:prepilin-type N-terminal cleavage/methylation domain-containing protein/prepilin-type processing-associated H-X9-DG protein
MRTKRGSYRGFSITELLVVVAVILILLSILLVGMHAMHSQAIALQCRHHLEQIGYALNMYSTTNHGLLPEPKSIYSGRLWYETLTATYLDNPAVLDCPAADEAPVVASAGSPRAPSEEVVGEFEKVLYWLKDIQEKTGDKKGQIPMINAAWSRKHDNVNTGIALMAFLGFGVTDRYPPEFADCVRWAVEFLSGPAQKDNGHFSAQLSHYAEDSHMIGSQAVPIMALAAAYQCIEDEGLRAQAREAAERGLEWLADQTAHHGGYLYNGPATDQARTSTCSWVYQAVGAARQAGFRIPHNITDAMQSVMDLNAASSQPGGMWKRWNPEGTGTGTFPYAGGSSRNWTDQGLVMRLYLGDSAQSSVVRNQIDGFILKPDSSGVPRRVADARDANGYGRFHYYHTGRGLRLAGGEDWEQWVTPNPAWNWEGHVDFVLKHLESAGNDDEGNPMAYWSDTGLVSYGSYQKQAWVTAFSLMMLSDAFENTWLDQTYEAAREGQCTYGYLLALGKTRQQPAADTILVMDYESWLITKNHPDPSLNDDDAMIPLRHSGRANALLGDGRVRPLDHDEITPGMWTLDPGD